MRISRRNRSAHLHIHDDYDVCVCRLERARTSTATCAGRSADEQVAAAAADAGGLLGTHVRAYTRTRWTSVIAPTNLYQFNILHEPRMRSSIYSYVSVLCVFNTRANTNK